MQIQISWLLKKPTDLDLHCLQSQGISGFSRTRVNIPARARILAAYFTEVKIRLKKLAFSDVLLTCIFKTAPNLTTEVMADADINISYHSA